MSYAYIDPLPVTREIMEMVKNRSNFPRTFLLRCNFPGLALSYTFKTEGLNLWHNVALRSDLVSSGHNKYLILEIVLHCDCSICLFQVVGNLPKSYVPKLRNQARGFKCNLVKTENSENSQIYVVWSLLAEDNREIVN